MDNRDSSDRLAEDFHRRMLDMVYRSSYRQNTFIGATVIMLVYLIFK